MKRTDFIIYLERHLDDMFGLAMHFCKNKATAEDLVQDLFINLCQKDIKLGNIHNPRAWLASIMYRLYVDHWRHQTRSPVLLAEDLSTDGEASLIDFTASNDSGPEDQAHQEKQRDKLVNALDRLGEKHKHVIILHDIEGYTLSEIETIMEVPVGTLKSRLHRAREKLQNMLKKWNQNPVSDVSLSTGHER